MKHGQICKRRCGYHPLSVFRPKRQKKTSSPCGSRSAGSSQSLKFSILLPSSPLTLCPPCWFFLYPQLSTKQQGTDNKDAAFWYLLLTRRNLLPDLCILPVLANPSRQGITPKSPTQSRIGWRAICKLPATLITSP